MGSLLRKAGASWEPVVQVARIHEPTPEPPSAPGSSPWAPLIESRNVIPTPDGSGATIHPSVYDFGAPWNGYRWWMANTPYPDNDVSEENPCIWGSNDRVNWTEPAPGINPLAGDPATPEMPGAFHSDTELEYEPTTGTLWMFWRLAPSQPADWIDLYAASSTDGATWTNHGAIHRFTSGPSWTSPAIVRVAVNDWRMFVMGGLVRWSATSPLGPWTYDGACYQVGGSGGFFQSYHGDIIRHGGYWWAIYSLSGYGYAAISTDSINWSVRSAPILRPGFIEYIYRPTMTPSTEAGYMDVWTSGYHAASPGGNVTAYTRAPMSFWTDLA